MSFFIYGEEEELDGLNIAEIQAVVSDFIQADVDTAVEYISVTGEEIRDLNARTRGIDKVTDVLSYPTLDGIKGKPLFKKAHTGDIDEEGRLIIGSIVVCEDRAREQADEYGHSYQRELHYLLIHGVLHCLGYDHMTDEDKSEMREKEEYLLGKLGITR
jgi:probable rRNA maturation factor